MSQASRCNRPDRRANDVLRSIGRRSDDDRRSSHGGSWWISASSRFIDWLMVGGGAAMLVLGWCSTGRASSIAGIRRTSGDGRSTTSSPVASRGSLVVAVGVLASCSTGRSSCRDAPWPLILLGAAGARHVADDHPPPPRRPLRRQPTAASACTAASSGAVHRRSPVRHDFTASGGDLNDLKDMNKLKAQLQQRQADGDVPAAAAPPPATPPATAAT